MMAVAVKCPAVAARPPAATLLSPSSSSILSCDHHLTCVASQNLNINIQSQVGYANSFWARRRRPDPISLSLAAGIPCYREPELRKSLRATILEDIKSTGLCMCLLYTKLNALAPVSLLPTELLVRIFHLLRDHRDYYKNVPQLPLLIAVTHVCRHWSEVALNDSSLWSTIWDHILQCNQKWLIEMLTRSENAPLDIQFHSPNADLLHALTRHSSRISRLSLFGLEDGGALRDLLKTEAPALEDLRMVAQSDVVSYDPSASTSQFRLFHRQSSKLQKMHLRDIHIPWAFFPKRTLTHLEIFFVAWCLTEEITRLGTLDDLIDVITNSPCLEQLTLNKCLPPVSSQPTALARTVTEMPRLCRLDLSGPSSSVLRIFQSLHAPVLRALTLRSIATNQAEVASWPTVAPSVLSRFHRMRSVTVKDLRLKVHGKYADTTIGVWSPSVFTPAVPLLSYYGTFVALEFQNHLPNMQEYHEAVWQKVCAALHMVELESVHVSISLPSNIEPPRWTQLFDQCANVTMVSAQWHGAESLLRSMTPRDPTPSVTSQDLDEPAPALLFPGLTRLFLEEFNFERSYSEAGSIYEIVLKLIERRKRCGAPIKELHIYGCHASPVEVASLDALVPKFRWDPKRR
ncbi:hypothetical protein BC834DRAFT_236174 [Gloeopeniophorella convolvens]|nr:hypothetical protein BC834DRAFT_236174 [Gloeopeniophorella convolvens]